MKSVKKIVDEALVASYDKMEGDEVLGKMRSILDKLGTKPIKDWELSRLSDAVSELSSLMVNLGQMVVDTKLESEASEEYRKSAYREVFLQLKKSKKCTDQVAKNQAESEIESLIENELSARHRAGIIRAFYNDVERLISVSQSRMKVIGGDLARVKL